jgi:hypothetical protein
VVVGDRLDDDAVHPATAHGHHGLALALLVVLGRHGHDGQPGGAGGFVGGPEDRVRVGNVADGRAYGGRDAAAQLPGALVRLVIERDDGPANPLGERLADRRVAIDDARYRAQRDSCFPRDVDHRRSPRAGDNPPAYLARTRHSDSFLKPRGRCVPVPEILLLPDKHLTRCQETLL